MKRFIMTLAAMLLVSLGTFAQSGATLKGDVNGDGKVDVEDVTSLVDIILSGETYGYFYFGTTQPTAENFQTLSGVLASYTSIGDAIGATASIDAGQMLYMFCPAAWMKGKKVDLEDGTGSTYSFIEDVDAETIPGYVIYRTQACNEATDLTLNFEITGGDEYYWYAGTNNGNEVNESNYTSVAEQVNSIPTTGTITANRQYIYFVMPSDKTLVSVMMGGFGANMGTPTIINNYKIYKSVSTIKGTVTYTIK